VCNAKAKAIDKPTIKPIILKGPNYQLVINLIDFRTFMCSLFCWILQYKDHFLKFIWLYALTDKEAATIAGAIGPHFRLNEKPVRM
jgi:hypothetical protein